MATTEFIAAIELGSSKIIGIAGKRNSDGSMQVLAYAQEDSSSFIHKGVVYNLNKTEQKLTSIIKKLEEKLDNKIAKAYVGISGQSLRTVQNVIVRDLDETVTISQELVDAISDENIEIPLVDMDILDVIPQEYKVGNYLQADPVGVACSHIEGRFLNIVARSLVKKNLEKSFEQANINIAELIITPVATGNYVLNETERRSGCALIDLGADTTTVSVYKNNMLRYLTVIPLGGSTITHDITTLQIEDDEAEKLKVTYGNATYEEELSDTPATCLLDDGIRTVEIGTLNNIIEARLEEIVSNVWNQIQLSGYDDKLLSGLVLTGGAANMKNIDDMFRKQCKIEKIRIARTGRMSVASDSDFLKKDGTQNSIIGLLFEGKDNCCQPKIVQPQPQQQPKPETSLFDDDEAIKEQEAMAKDILKRKEEEKRRKEEEDRKRRKKEEEEERKRKEREAKKKKGPNIIEKMFNDLTNSFFSDDEVK